MKDAHLTIRLPEALARALARRAARFGVPKSQVARDAVAQYLAPAVEAGSGASAPKLTARALAGRWSDVPRLDLEEARAFAADISAGRRALPGLGDPWL